MMYETSTGRPYQDMTVKELRYVGKAYVARGRRLHRMRKHELIVALYEADAEYASDPEEAEGARAALAAYLRPRHTDASEEQPSGGGRQGVQSARVITSRPDLYLRSPATGTLHLRSASIGIVEEDGLSSIHARCGWRNDLGGIAIPARLFPDSEYRLCKRCAAIEP